MADIVVGIDLGTTNTLACYLKQGKPQLIKFPSSGNMLPSVLYVDKAEDGTKILIGEKARKKMILDSRNGIRSSKTYMGNINKKWNCRGMEFTPTEVATEILKRVREAVIKKLGSDPEKDVVNAVITVPAYFNSNQYEETKKAGEAAGIKILRIISEPMSAAVAAVKEENSRTKILVVDIGGGTFDLSILAADPANNKYNVIDVDGDRCLGGDDIDEVFYQYLLKSFEEEYDIDLSTVKSSGLAEIEYYSLLGRLKEEAEERKKELSEEEETEVLLTNLMTYKGQSCDFNVTIERDDFDEVCAPIYKRIFDRLQEFVRRQAAEKGKTGWEDIGGIVLAGGSCQIPYIHEQIEMLSGKSVQVSAEISELVVRGACFIAEWEYGDQVTTTPEEILSHSFGIKVLKNGKDVFHSIIKKGTKYPCEAADSFTTTVDFQECIDIEVYEAGSDCENVADIDKHDYYGMIELQGIEVAPRNIPDIEVTFSFDKNRCLTVTAEDMKTKAKKQAVITKGERPASRVLPMNFVLLLDTSGSMGGSMGDVRRAACALAGEIIDLNVHKMGIVTFDDDAKTYSELSQSAEMLHQRISSIYSGGGTALCAGFEAAEKVIARASGEKVIIVVTDGCPNSERGSIRTAEQLRAKGIKIVAIGAGSIRESFLQKLVGTENFYLIRNMGQLQETFKMAINKIMSK